VESTLTKDMSAWPRRAASAIIPSISAANTPMSRHWVKRSQTVCQAPNSAGISRHWLPARNRQMMPSNCSRRRCGKGPYRPIGRKGSISCHSPSLSSRRVTAAFYQLGVTLGSETDRIDHDSRRALVGSGPDAIAITPDSKTAYVADGGSNTVIPISTATNTAGTPIPAGDSAIAIAITPHPRPAPDCGHAGSGNVARGPTPDRTQRAGPAADLFNRRCWHDTF